MSEMNFPTMGRRARMAVAAGLIALLACLALLGSADNPAKANSENQVKRAPSQAVLLGQAGLKARPNCPDQCTALAIGNILQGKIGDVANAYRVPFAGKITRWNIALGKPIRKDWLMFKERFGAPKAGLAVLRKVKVKGKVRFRLRVRTALQGLGRYLGSTAGFTPARPIPVHKGEFVALVVPTWAPALSQTKSTDGSWVVSRKRSTCMESPNMQNSKPQLKLGSLAEYGCRFTGIATYRVRVVSR